MSNYSMCFDFNILYGKETVKSDGFCIDARYYLAQQLECDWGDVENVVEKAGDKTFKSIAKWAASGCDYIAGVVQEGASDIQSSVATEISGKLAEGCPDDYDEIYEDIFDKISYKITKLELIIDGKVYK